ncbi:MAG: hypothetical protein COC23_03075 [Hyphomicrobiales bacterium]|nr:MAG: hypothetical protein COC23_03075 [Hyphomicrobiales bacterium]
MTTIQKTVRINADIDSVWAKISDTAGISNLIGFLASSVQNGDTRTCTLDQGGELVEKIISVDPKLKRVMYSITKSPLNMEFHAASMQVNETENGSELVWTVDLLPPESVEHMEPMLAGACADMETTLAS